MASIALSRRAVLSGAAAVGVLSAAGCASAPRRVAASVNPAEWDAVETARRISSGEVTAFEVTNAAIARAQASDAALNAIVTPTYDTAREAATAGQSGPFAGVPTFIKDLEDVAGVRTQFGSRAFSENIAARTSAFADAYGNAGVISLGKSSTPEFGLTATTEPLVDGPTRNPWNLDHSTGGSSGGAAALVAAGVVPMAHASDGGGSIRIPASCCGLVGLKPSRGRLIGDPVPADVPVNLSVDGVETRTVRDTAVFLAACENSGADAPLTPVGLVSAPSDAPLRMGFFADGGGLTDVDPEVAEAVRAAAGLCESMGHGVEEIAHPFDDPALGDAFLLYWAAGVENALSNFEAQTGATRNEELFEPLTLSLASYFQARADQFEAAVGRLVSFQSEYAALMEGYDVLISPVLSTPAPEIGYLATDLPFEEQITRVTRYAAFTGFHNVAGSASMSLPLTMSSSGLPIGTQFAGAVGAERTLLELAYALEEAAPWADRRPPNWTG